MSKKFVEPVRCEKCRELWPTLYQVSDNLGIKQRREISFEPSRDAGAKIKEKSVWEDSDKVLENGFYCKRCGVPVDITEYTQENFRIIDTRVTPMRSDEFDAARTLEQLKAKYPDDEFFINVVQGMEGEYAEVPVGINKGIRTILKDNFGIEKLYKHQADAIEKILKGKNVVIASSTASGKTLCYNLPILNALSTDNELVAFYIAPLKALSMDQIKQIARFGDLQKYTYAIHRFREDGLVDQIINKRMITIARYDGDITDKPLARNVAIGGGNIFYTTPEKIHYSILQYWDWTYTDGPDKLRWDRVFKNLRYVVIDEVHTYRGVFGANMAMLMRRLRRMCEYHGNTDLQFICCSATIANPKELCERLVGLPFECIDYDTAPKHKQVYVLWNPGKAKDREERRKPTTVAIDVISDFMTREKPIRTLCFGRSISTVVRMERNMSNRIEEKTRGQHRDQLVKFFKADIEAGEKSSILDEMNVGEIHTLVSTVALQVGVDIEDVQTALIVGYPGSLSAFYQETGRAGRKGEGLNIFALQEHPLEQYFFRNSEEFFKKDRREPVRITLDNKEIVYRHLKLCAWEGGILPNRDRKYFEKYVDKFIAEHEDYQRKLEDFEKAKELYMSLRTKVSESFVVIDEDFGEEISSQIDGFRARRDLFPGAVYRTNDYDYVIQKVEWREGKAFAKREEEKLGYYTQSFGKESTSVLEELKSPKPFEFGILKYGLIRFMRQTLGFYKKSFYRQDKANAIPFAQQHVNLPPPIDFCTTSFFVDFDTMYLRNTFPNASWEDMVAGIRGVENALLVMFPEIVECDTNDIGGLTVEDEKRASIQLFLYDGMSGGLDISEEAYERPYVLFEKAFNLVKTCPCTEVGGCPSCIQIFRIVPTDLNKEICLKVLEGMKNGDIQTNS